MLEEGPLVSVVIPTYNRIKILPRAINSIINQKYPNWELLIIDDGSIDGTRELIQNKYLNNSRIHFFERPDSRPKGASACRNIGIEKALGRYIALLDSDDEWKYQHLEECIKKAEEVKDFHGCYSGAVVRRGKFEFKKDSRSIMADESYIDFLLGSGFAPTPTLFMERDYALDIKFDESLQRHQDWDFFIRFGKKYSWCLNSQINTIVNRDLSVKEVDLNSCIQFYRKYKSDILHERNKEKYLYSMFKRAILNRNAHAEEFYLTELKRVANTTKSLLKYPFLFKMIEQLKCKLHYPKIRRMAIFAFLHFTNDDYRSG